MAHGGDPYLIDELTRLLQRVDDSIEARNVHLFQEAATQLRSRAVELEDLAEHDGAKARAAAWLLARSSGGLCECTFVDERSWSNASAGASFARSGFDQFCRELS